MHFGSPQVQASSKLESLARLKEAIWFVPYWGLLRQSLNCEFKLQKFRIMYWKIRLSNQPLFPIHYIFSLFTWRFLKQHFWYSISKDPETEPFQMGSNIVSQNQKKIIVEGRVASSHAELHIYLTNYNQALQNHQSDLPPFFNLSYKEAGQRSH